MHVVMPDQGIPQAAPAGSAKPAGDAGNAAAAGGIFAALLAALQQAAVEVLPSTVYVASVETNAGDTVETEAATEVVAESDGDEAPANAAAEGDSAHNAATTIAVGPILEYITAPAPGGDAKTSLADGDGAREGDAPTMSSLHDNVAAKTATANASGQASASVFARTGNTASERLSPAAPTVADVATHAIKPAISTAQGAQTATGQAPLASKPPLAEISFVNNVAMLGDDEGNTLSQATGPVSARTTPGPGSESLQQAPALLIAANNGAAGSKTGSRVPGDAAVDNTSQPVAPPANTADEPVATDSPRFGAEDVVGKDVAASSKSSAESLFHVRSVEGAAPSDKPPALGTAAGTALAGTDTQSPTGAAGVQARNDAQVNVPAQPQAPELPPRPAPADLTQFAVKSVRYLAGRGEETMTVRLVPESLGELRLVVKSGEHSLDVQLSAANASVRDSLEQQLPALREALARDAGDARQVNITINTGTDQQSAGSQFARQFAAAGSFEQHSRHEQGEVLHESSYLPTRQPTHAGQLDVRA